MGSVTRWFSAVHPFVSFFYFLLVFLSLFSSQNPVILGLAFGSALLYQLAMNGWRAACKALLAALPVAALMLLINPLFNHSGATPLFYVNGAPFTLEAMVYGGVTALTIVDTLLWFFIANDSFTQDHVVYLFGKWFPTGALLIGMIFRITSYLQKELLEIRNAQRGMGVQTERGGRWAKLKNGVSLFLCLTGNALESSVDTAVAMKSRGYGLPGGSRRRCYRFRRRDGALLAVILLLAAVPFWCFFRGAFAFSILPALTPLSLDGGQVLVCVLYGAFLNLPFCYNAKEELRWMRSKSKM